MSITQFQYVIELKKHGSFQKAAKACHVTQPTLSMQIAKLEDQLGTIIFDRSKSPVLVTDLGEKIIEQAQIALFEYRKVEELIKSQNKIMAGDFKVGVIPTIAPYLLPRFVEKFSKTYPKVKLTVNELRTCEIIDRLQSDELDAGIVSTPLSNDKIIERHLYYEPFCLFASPKSGLLDKEMVKEDDLQEKELWLYRDGHCFHNQSMKICSSHLFENRQIKFESGNMETLKNLVINGDGGTFLPYLATLGLPANHKKMVRRFTQPEPTREISIIHSRSFLKEKIIDAFEEFIVDSLPAEITSLKSKKIKILDVK